MDTRLKWELCTLRKTKPSVRVLRLRWKNDLESFLAILVMPVHPTRRMQNVSIEFGIGDSEAMGPLRGGPRASVCCFDPPIHRSELAQQRPGKEGERHSS